MDGNKSTNGNYGGLKPLEVPTRPKRRTASNGGALDNATSTSNGGSDTTSSFDPRRGRSADGARTHHRRVSNMANDGGDTEVVQSTGTKISPTSPVHRTGYHSQGEAEADRTPSDFDIGEFYGQPSISPRRSTEAGAVVAASAAVAANPMHPTRPGRISNFLSRLTFTHAGKHNAQVIPEPLPSAEPTPSKPVSISGWSKISTSWTAGRLSGYDWKDSFSSKQEMMEDDLKSSKPSSPAGIMIQQKKRCRCLNDHTMIGMAVVGLGELETWNYWNTYHIAPFVLTYSVHLTSTNQLSFSCCSSSLFPPSLSPSATRKPLPLPKSRFGTIPAFLLPRPRLLQLLLPRPSRLSRRLRVRLPLLRYACEGRLVCRKVKLTKLPHPFTDNSHENHYETASHFAQRLGPTSMGRTTGTGQDPHLLRRSRHDGFDF